ncbi:tetratricopeptide repeat-containing sensor histidine kinase [Hyunsoonleella rubra]|uniref:histidine kinase n=1 Tax=Hyunsoonleella rubra TaxID=1737062 RepID=A0ABW5TBN5_9FLAO
MKYSFILVASFFLLSVCGFSQANKVIDSLKLQLSEKQSDTTEVQVLNDLAYYYAFQNLDSSIVYGKQGLVKASRIGSYKGKARANLYLGNAFIHSNQYDSAHYYLNDALKIAKANEVNQSAIYSSFGMLHKAEGNYEKAIETYFAGIKYDENSNNEYGKFVKLINLANTYSKLENITKSVEYESKALDLAKNSDNDNINFAVGTLLNNIGGSYAKLENFDKSLEYFSQSLAVNLENQNRKEIARNHNNLGFIYEKKENFPRAIEHLKKALEIREEFGDEDELIETQMMLGTVYGSTKNYQLSEYHFKKALELANKIDDKSLISEVYLAMSDSYAKRNNYLNALNSFKKHARFKDSILLANSQDNINEIEIKYQTEKKDKEIVKQQLEIQKRKAQNNYMLVGLIILIVGVLTLIFIYKQHQKRKSQEILALKRESQIKTLEALIEGEENERLRIAKELHDGVNGDLSAIKYKLSALMETNTKLITEAISMIDESCKQVRAISHNLVPPSLKNFNLVEAIADYCNNLNSINPKEDIIFQHLGDDIELSQKAEVNVFRIIQELVTNSLKHAEANTINVQLSHRDNSLQITVEDDGKGFDKDAVGQNGIGLNNVQSRIDYLKADVDFESNDSGTSYIIEIDLEKLDDN